MPNTRSQEKEGKAAKKTEKKQVVMQEKDQGGAGSLEGTRTGVSRREGSPA